MSQRLWGRILISPASISGRLSSAGRPVWQPNRLLDISPPLQLFGGLVVLLDAVAFLLVEPLSRASTILLVLVTGWAVFRHGRQLLRSPVAWLFAASILVQILSWTGVLLSHPEWAESSPKMHRLGHWFAFAAIACWLGGSTRNTLALWLVALVALLLTPWVVGGGFSEWALGASGQRIDFNIHNAQHTSMLFGTALMGLLVLAPRLFRSARPLPVAIPLWLAAVAICTMVVLFTQTRAVWLGLFLVAVFLAACGLYVAVRKYGSKSWPLFLILAAFASALVVLAARPGGIVAERLKYENETIDAVLDGNIEDADYTSAGIRIHIWAEALPWIQERPLLGWGGKGRKLVIAESETFPRELKDSFGHLHNSYVDLQVNNGLLGTLLLLALTGWLLLASVKTWRRGELPGDLLLFFLCFMLYWLVINCFESYLFFSSGGYIFGLVCAGVATHILRADYSVGGRESAKN